MTEAQRDHILRTGSQLREALIELEHACRVLSAKQVSECMDDIHGAWDDLIEGTAE